MNDDAELTSERKLFFGVLVGFVATALLAGWDLVLDVQEGTSPVHAGVETAIVLVGLAGGAIVARRLLKIVRDERSSRQQSLDLARRLQETEAEAARWRAEARDLLNGLAAAFERQFERWALSPAEKEVALLLLKGLSHKEIASVRSITEATARQQARAVYKKSGLSGRNDLAAFFLEDLLLPSDASRGARPTQTGQDS